jgi:hypothetical protein
MTRRFRFFLLPLLLYIAFAAAVYLVEGAEPELSIDHIAYFKLADGIRVRHSDGAYWRDFDALRSYAVLLAYGYDLTASHIMSLKLLLASMTVAYLVAFEHLLFFFTGSRRLAVLFSLLSALFVSFGASFWGMTDFAASLHRTLIVPFLVLITWFFLRFRDSPWRYATYPLLVALSLLHLSSYHLLLVLLAYEAIDFLILRRGRLDRRLLFFAAGLCAALIARYLLGMSGLAFTDFVDDALALAFGKVGTLGHEEAWAIEIYAFPWRNMPPPIATLANILLSYGAIFALSIAGAIAARRHEGWSELDRVMLAFAGAVVAAAYGLQTLLWGLRNLLPIFPINFEEIRAVSFLMIPSVYFVSRFVAMLWREGDWNRRAIATAIVFVFVLQPVLVLRASPVGWREALVERLTRVGVLKGGDTFRKLYVRQYLGLASEGPRFYYSVRGVLDWLERNARQGDRVLTDRNEIQLAGLPVVGVFQNIMAMRVTATSRRAWKNEVDGVAQALASRDIDSVRRAAKTWNATLVIVPWSEAGALYQDENFSVLRVE